MGLEQNNMTGVHSTSKRSVLSLAWAAGLLAVSVGAASAQNFSSYNSNHAILLDGYTFSINGVAQTDLSNIGTSGTYEFGFTNSGPIHILITGGNVFGNVSVVTIG